MFLFFLVLKSQLDDLSKDLASIKEDKTKLDAEVNQLKETSIKDGERLKALLLEKEKLEKENNEQGKELQAVKEEVARIKTESEEKSSRAKKSRTSSSSAASSEPEVSTDEKKLRKGVTTKAKKMKEKQAKEESAVPVAGAVKSKGHSPEQKIIDGYERLKEDHTDLERKLRLLVAESKMHDLEKQISDLQEKVTQV